MSRRHEVNIASVTSGFYDLAVGMFVNEKLHALSRKTLADD